MCATTAKLTASAFQAEMVAVPERPHELSNIALILQRHPSGRGRLEVLHILTCFCRRLPMSVLCAFVVADTAAHHRCRLPQQ